MAYVELNRDKAARYGITAADVDTALYNSFGQRLVSTILPGEPVSRGAGSGAPVSAVAGVI